MKITKRQNRKILAEGFKFTGSRFGFLGTGFGETYKYDPYRSLREGEELEAPEAVEDAWAGGDNLEQPVDHEEVYAPELVSERQIRSAIYRVLKK